MLFKSEVLTQASGSIGGVTYSHNKSGMYRRARSIPTNPNTGFQEQVRSGLTQAVTRWTEDLSPAQRASWNLYASNVPVLNPLGSSILLSGQNMYIRTSTVVAQANSKINIAIPITAIDDAPAIFDLGGFTTPSFTAAVGAGISVSFTPTDDWAVEEFAFMQISMSRPQNQSVNYYNGPWRLISAIGGNIPAPTSPHVISAANIALRGYVYALNQRVWLRVRVWRVDNRLSTERQIGPIVTTV